MEKGKIVKILVWILGIVIGLILLILIFISPIAKYIIEHNSEKWIGRQVMLTQLSINLFNGKVNVGGLKILEKDKKTQFIGVQHLLVDIDEGKLFHSVYRIEHLHIDDPEVRVVQEGMKFNYDDILTKFLSDTTKKEKKSADTVPAKYFLEDVAITGGKIEYIYEDYQLDAKINKASVSTPMIAWNDPRMKFHYGFELETGGGVSGDFGIDIHSLDFNMKLALKDFDLTVLKPYLTPYLQIKGFKGFFSTDIAAKGNFNKPKAIALKGTMDLNKLLILDDKNEKVIGVGSLSVKIDSLDIGKNIWAFGDILVKEPYFRYEMYPETNNFSRLVIASSASDSARMDTSASVFPAGNNSNPFILLANYVSKLAKDIIITDYKVSRFSINEGKVEFMDHTLDEEFNLRLSSLGLDVQQVNPSKGRATVELNTAINQKGFMKATVDVNPLDLLDFDITYELKNVAVVDYNPYSVFNIAYPFTKGKFNYSGTCSVKNHQIKMDNKIFIERIYAGKRVQNKTAVKLPIKLALAIMRDKDGNINLVVPVEGDLSDPKFNWWKVAMQVLKNLLVKAAAAPANLFASVFGGKEEDFKELKFDYDQVALTEKQVEKFQAITKVLEEKPELTLELKQVLDSTKDIEFISYFEAKKRYYFEEQKKLPIPDSLADEDKAAIKNIDLTGLEFRAWLDRKLNNQDPEMSTFEKCVLLIGDKQLQAMHALRMNGRNQFLERYFLNTLKLSKEKFSISNSSDSTLIPEDKIPRYFLSYTVPE